MCLKGVVVVSTTVSPTIPATDRIANRPIVCHAVEALAAAGIEHVAVVASPSVVAQVRRCFESDSAIAPNLTYLPQEGRMDLVGSLRAAAPFVGEDAAVAHFGDGLLGQPLDHFTRQLTDSGADLLLLLHQSSSERDRLAPGIQRLLGVAELDGTRTHLALAGVCLFGPGIMHRAAMAVSEEGDDVDLMKVAERLAIGGCVLEARFTPTWRRYGGDPRDLLELNRIVLDQQIAGDSHFDRGDNLIEGRVVIHPSAHVSSSTIFGPVIIGADARVADAYIGPYTAIGTGARVEGAEVVRSIVADGACIMHISGRIEGSTIGPRANIFRDFSLPRALRLHVGEGVEVALD